MKKYRGKIPRICKNCGSGFTVEPNQLLYKKCIYCSIKCSAEGRKRFNPIVLSNYICEECKKPFSRRKTGKQKYRFCSTRCFIAMRSREWVGEKHPGWKGEKTARTRESYLICRKSVRRIGKCEKCGSTENLHAHHILPYSEYPEFGADPNNIEVLCAVCHAKEHPQFAHIIEMPRIKTGKEVSCLVCGKTRYITLAKIKYSKYCSNKCSGLGRSIEWREKINGLKQKAMDSRRNISSGVLSFGC